MIWNYICNIGDFANLYKNEIYRDGLKLCWNAEACKSAYKSAYSISKFVRACNY